MFSVVEGVAGRGEVDILGAAAVGDLGEDPGAAVEELAGVGVVGEHAAEEPVEHGLGELVPDRPDRVAGRFGFEGLLDRAPGRVGGWLGHATLAFVGTRLPANAAPSGVAFRGREWPRPLRSPTPTPPACPTHPHRRSQEPYCWDHSYHLRRPFLPRMDADRGA